MSELIFPDGWKLAAPMPVRPRMLTPFGAQKVVPRTSSGIRPKAGPVVSSEALAETHMGLGAQQAPTMVGAGSANAALATGAGTPSGLESARAKVAPTTQVGGRPFAMRTMPGPPVPDAPGVLTQTSGYQASAKPMSTGTWQAAQAQKATPSVPVGRQRRVERGSNWSAETAVHGAAAPPRNPIEQAIADAGTQMQSGKENFTFSEGLAKRLSALGHQVPPEARGSLKNMQDYVKSLGVNQSRYSTLSEQGPTRMVLAEFERAFKEAKTSPLKLRMGKKNVLDKKADIFAEKYGPEITTGNLRSHLHNIQPTPSSSAGMAPVEWMARKNELRAQMAAKPATGLLSSVRRAVPPAIPAALRSIKRAELEDLLAYGEKLAGPNCGCKSCKAKHAKKA